MDTLITIVISITIIVSFTLLLIYMRTIEKLRIYSEDGVIFTNKKEPNIKCIITNIEMFLNNNSMTILVKYPTGYSCHVQTNINNFLKEWEIVAI
jgi:hypothetical protein